MSAKLNSSVVSVSTPREMSSHAESYQAFDSMRRALRGTSYPLSSLADVSSLIAGRPSAFIPIISYLCFCYDKRFTAQIGETYGLRLTNTDTRLVELIFKVMRCEFGMRIPITISQFFHNGYAVVKLALVDSLARAVIARCKGVKAASVRSSPCNRRIGENNADACNTSVLSSKRASPVPFEDSVNPAIYVQKRPPIPTVSTAGADVTLSAALEKKLNSLLKSMEDVAARVSIIESRLRIVESVVSGDRSQTR